MKFISATVSINQKIVNVRAGTGYITVTTPSGAIDFRTAPLNAKELDTATLKALRELALCIYGPRPKASREPNCTLSERNDLLAFLRHFA